MDSPLIEEALRIVVLPPCSSIAGRFCMVNDSSFIVQEDTLFGRQSCSESERNGREFQAELHRPIQKAVLITSLYPPRQQHCVQDLIGAGVCTSDMQESDKRQESRLGESVREAEDRRYSIPTRVALINSTTSRLGHQGKITRRGFLGLVPAALIRQPGLNKDRSRQGGLFSALCSGPRRPRNSCGLWMMNQLWVNCMSLY